MVPPALAAAPALPRGPGASAAEFLAWADSHQRHRRRHDAEMAQITRHPEQAPERDAIGQQRAWARRHGREQRLRASAMAQLRPGSVQAS